MKDDTENSRNHLLTAIISCIISLILYGTLRFYSDWFIISQVKIMLGGYIGSWLFIFSLTSVSNIEMMLFGDHFSAKLIPEILFCLIVSAIALGTIHRVCATTCVLFSLLGLYFVERISQLHYNKLILNIEPVHPRKGGNKKYK